MALLVRLLGARKTIALGVLFLRNQAPRNTTMFGREVSVGNSCKHHDQESRADRHMDPM